MSRRIILVAVTVLAAVSVGLPASAATPNGGRFAGPPYLICDAPGLPGGGWGFEPGHGLQMCIDVGGHPAGPIALRTGS